MDDGNPAANVPRSAPEKGTLIVAITPTAEGVHVLIEKGMA